MKTIIKSNPLIAFFLLTFTFTWLWWGVIIIFQLPMKTGYVPFLLGAAGPSLAAFLVSAVCGGRQEVKALWNRVAHWRFNIGWYLAALFLPALVTLGALGLNFLINKVVPDFKLLQQSWFLLPVALITGMLLGGPLEEEFGWRGFALIHLQKKVNALTASVIVGVFWGLWHLPAFLIPWSSQHGIPIALFLLHDIALAVIFTWIFNNTNGSVWMVMLAHTAFNLTITVLPITPGAAGNDQPLIFAVILLYAAAVAIVLAFGPKSLTGKSITFL